VIDIQRAYALLSEILDSEVNPQDTLAMLEADSLSVIEWVFTLEEEFGIKIPDDKLVAVTGDMPVCEVVELLLP
jgi:acyl carrier protein